MKRRHITVACYKGVRRIRPIWRRSHFAVHARLVDFQTGATSDLFFTCTHLPTGRSCGDCYRFTREQAIAAARALIDSRLDWSFTDPFKMPHKTRRIAESILARIARAA